MLLASFSITSKIVISHRETCTTSSKQKATRIATCSLNTKRVSKTPAYCRYQIDALTISLLIKQVEPLILQKCSLRNS